MKSRKCTLHISYRFATKSRSHTRKKPCLLCLGILVAQQAVGRLVLFNGGEAAYRGIETVVSIIIVTLADFTQQNWSCALFDGEVMIQILLHMNAFSRGKADLCAGRNSVCFSISMNGNIRFIVNFFVWKTVVDFNQHIASTTINDVFCLKPVEMIRSILTFF